MNASDKNVLLNRILVLEDLVKEYPQKTCENVLQQLKAIFHEVNQKEGKL